MGMPLNVYKVEYYDTRKDPHSDMDECVGQDMVLATGWTDALRRAASALQHRPMEWAMKSVEFMGQSEAPATRELAREHIWSPQGDNA